MKKDKKKPQKESILAQSLQMPEELLKGDSIISLTGNHKAWIENYKGIIEYGKNCIRIQTRVCRITFTGRNLEIVYYTNVDMKISGEIESICYS